MSKKSFDKKYMHPTRRKLVDMVKTGRYDKNTTIGWDSEKILKREIGEKWEDDFNKYEQHDGFVVKSSKNSDSFQEIRDYIKNSKKCKNPDCSKVNMIRVDEKLIKKTGYCMDCLSNIETKIRIDGLWEDYQNYRIWTRMIIDGKMRLEQIQQAHDEAKQVYEYMNEDGTIDEWKLPQDVEEIKKEMMELIKTGKEEIREIEELRNKAFENLKGKDYEHIL